MKEALKLAAEFDKRFTSMNGIDVPERVNVPRDEWRALHDAIKQALASPVREPVCPACESIEWEGQPCQICQPTPAQPAPVQEEDLYDLAVKADNGGQP